MTRDSIQIIEIPNNGGRILFVFTSADIKAALLAPRALMNLRCAICCLNMESPRERHGPVSALFMAVHLRRQFILPAPGRPVPRPSSSLCRFSFLASPASPASLPRLVNLDPGNAAKRGRRWTTRARKARHDGRGGTRRGTIGRRWLKYHEDIIRYTRRRRLSLIRIALPL